MRRLRNKLSAPMWYILLVALVIAALILNGMVIPYLRLANGIPINITPYDNPHMWEKVPPIVSYAKLWGATDIASALICLFLGLVCLLLGAARTINKLSGKQIYMQGLFLVLFAVYTLSMVESFTRNIHPLILFYTCWITFFIYPIPLFIYYFYYFAPTFQKWTWPLLAVPITYTAAAFVTFFVFRLPLDIPGRPYTPIMVACFIIFLLLGLFGVRQKSMAWFVRAISGFWFGWLCYILIKTQLGKSFYLYDEFKNGVTISAIIIVCFLVFFNMRELAESKSDLQILSMQNRLSIESYERIRAHLREVGGLKHEIRNHIAAMQLYLKDGRYEDAQNYLSQFADGAGIVTEAVYHDNYLINAVVGNVLGVAREHNIKVELNLKPASVHVSDPDLYSLLSNILDNALEACEMMPDGGERFIHLTISQREPYLNIFCKNSKAGEIVNVKGKIHSSKLEPGHGYGLWTMGRVVEKYDGMMNIEYDENTFSVTAALKNDL